MYEIDSIINNEEKIIREYNSLRGLLFSLASDLEDIIPSLLGEEGIEYNAINYRVKTESSLRKKIEFKNKYQSATDVTDLVGVRIITLYESDIERTYKILAREFDIVEVTDKRKKNKADIIDFGYNSLHLILEFNAERCNLPEYKKYSGLKFEIQLRTSLQHTWAAIEHGLGYKSKYEIPQEIRRRLARVSATLELLDEEFENLRACVKNYNNSINHTDKVLKTDINKNSLIQYVNNSAEIRDFFSELSAACGKPVSVDSELISKQKLIQKYTFIGYRSINEIDTIIKEKKDTLMEIATSWVNAANPEELNIFNILIFIMIFAVEGEAPAVASKVLKY